MLLPRWAPPAAMLFGYTSMTFGNSATTHLQAVYRDGLGLPAATVGQLWLAFVVACALAEACVGARLGRSTWQWILAPAVAAWTTLLAVLFAAPLPPWAAWVLFPATGLTHGFLVILWMSSLPLVFTTDAARTDATPRKQLATTAGFVGAMVVLPLLAGPRWEYRWRVVAVVLLLGVVWLHAASSIAPLLQSRLQVSFRHAVRGYGTSLRVAVADVSARALLSSDLLSALANSLVTAAFPLFARYCLNLTSSPVPLHLGWTHVMVPGGVQLPVLLAVYYASGLMSAPMWARLGKRFSIPGLWQLDCALYGLLLFLTTAAVSSFTTSVASTAALGTCVSGFMAYPDVLIGRVVDASQLPHDQARTCVASVRALARRGANACQGLLMGYLLAWSGFVSGQAYQSEHALWAVRMLLGVVPPVLLMGSAAAMHWFHPVGRGRKQA